MPRPDGCDVVPPEGRLQPMVIIDDRIRVLDQVAAAVPTSAAQIMDQELKIQNRRQWIFLQENEDVPVSPVDHLEGGW